MSKILVIRMLEMGDVASIAVPTIRQLQRQNPQAEIYCLTHGLGADVVKLAAPSAKVLTLPNHEWPDNILHSLEAFLGLAETIIEIGFEQIINLDTAFMPCVLARFLKDAGEPVQGNYLSVPLQKLIEQIQNQSLLPEYVNNAGEYMHSTFMGMSRWHSQWWISDNLPDGGYPEYYLTRCCGFNSMPLDWHIDVEPAKKYQNVNQRIIYLALNDLQHPYSELNELKTILKNNGYLVIQDDEQESLGLRLQGLKASDLLVCLPNAMFSLATCVETPTLLIPGQLDPRILMPDYAADQADEFPTATELAQSITSIFEAQQNA